MKAIEFELSEPIDGIGTLVFYAPTRGELKFATRVQGAIASASMKIAESQAAKARSASDEEVEGSDEEDDKTSQEKGDIYYQVMLMHEMEATCEIIDDFVTRCTNSRMCQANGGSVPKSLWDKVLADDIRKAFGAFLGNFITI